MKNRYLAAFQEPANIIGLTSVAALSAAFLNPLPLLAGLVLQAAYLIFVPDMKWYAARLSRLNDGDVQKRREELKAQTLPRLRPSLRARFEKLEETRADIDRQATSDADWMREVLRKLDYLLEKFLQFGLKDEQFRQYLAETRAEVERAAGTYRIGPDEAGRRNLRMVEGPKTRRMPNDSRPETPQNWVGESVGAVQAAYDFELGAIRGQRAAESDENTCAILDKRLEVLQRRREFIGKIGKIVTNLNHQLALLEDTFGLISDELLARPPEQVLADIEDVVSQTNTMTQVLEELAPYERMLSSIDRAQAGVG